MLYCSLTYCSMFTAKAGLSAPTFCAVYKDVLECTHFKNTIDMLTQDSCAEGVGKCASNSDGVCAIPGLDVHTCPRRYLIIATRHAEGECSVNKKKPVSADSDSNVANYVFKSPQTGSEYTIANTSKDVFVCYREVDKGFFRVRIQGALEHLDAVRGNLTYANKWGAIKDADHLSIVCKELSFADVVGDAVRAVVLAGFC